MKHYTSMVLMTSEVEVQPSASVVSTDENSATKIVAVTRTDPETRIVLILKLTP